MQQVMKDGSMGELDEYSEEKLRELLADPNTDHVDVMTHEEALKRKEQLEAEMERREKRNDEREMGLMHEKEMKKERLANREIDFNLKRVKKLGMRRK